MTTIQLHIETSSERSFQLQQETDGTKPIASSKAALADSVDTFSTASSTSTDYWSSSGSIGAFVVDNVHDDDDDAKDGVCRSGNNNSFSTRSNHRRSRLSRDDNDADEEGEMDNSRRSCRSVTFDSVHIHEHKVTLGDHPSTMFGPPVTINWQAVSSKKLLVDDFESITIYDDDFDDGDGEKFTMVRPRRSGAALRLPSDVRRDLLQDVHSVSEMRRAESEARKVRSERAITIALTEVERVELCLQSIRRKFQKWRRKSSNKPLSDAEKWLNTNKKQRRRTTAAPERVTVTPSESVESYCT